MRNTAIAAITVLIAASSTVAQDYEIDWWTVDGGGDMWSSGGQFELSGTISQADAGAVITGGDFELAGGFWPGVERFCFGDLNDDGEIGLSDLAELLGHYGITSGAAYYDGDLDTDGDVDLADLAALLGIYGTTCD